MARSKVFVSYSHVDREWRQRIQTHFAVLEWQDLIETWSDTRIKIGATWADEIDNALATCQVAVLVVTPNFLASKFIRNEIRTIFDNHARSGLSILPVIARPCAWRLVDFLKDIQCRPVDGRALSLGSEPQIDEDLAKLTYELGALVRPPIWDLESSSPAPPRPTKRVPRREVNGQVEAARLSGTSWKGTYGPVGGDRNQSVGLFVDRLNGDRLTGTMQWGALDGTPRTSTKITGTVRPYDPAESPPVPSGLVQGGEQPELVLQFTDHDADGSSIQAGGDYRAVLVRGGGIVGQWFSTQTPRGAVGEFSLTQVKSEGKRTVN